MNASLVQVEEKMKMQAEQLEAGELHLVQQQATLTSQEAELRESQTAFQERVTAHSQMHSRLNGATPGHFSFAVSICDFSYALGISCCSCLFAH
jgi:predicted  nucleic acid-binding Zn-ribbon protein